jgi:hypothetical protein
MCNLRPSLSSTPPDYVRTSSRPLDFLWWVLGKRGRQCSLRALSVVCVLFGLSCVDDGCAVIHAALLLLVYGRSLRWVHRFGAGSFLSCNESTAP